MVRKHSDHRGLASPQLLHNCNCLWFMWSLEDGARCISSECWSPFWMRLIYYICVSKRARSITVCLAPSLGLMRQTGLLGRGAVSFAHSTWPIFNVEKFRRRFKGDSVAYILSMDGVYWWKLKWQLKVPISFLSSPMFLCKRIVQGC